MKILYGVPSEGMGHATRSKVIISHLLKNNHDVRIVTSDRAYKFLKKQFPGRVYEIAGFHLAYREGSVSKMKTFASILKNGPKDLATNFHEYRIIHKEFKADLVISDFESFTFFFAKFHKTPLISIDNMQIINRCKLDIAIPNEEKENYLLAKNIIKIKIPNCNHYLITTFFPAEIRKRATTLTPPILREKIIKAKVSNGNHIVVYQTSTSQKNLIKILRSIHDDKFHVYGFNKQETHGNVILKPFSEDGFIADLASAKAVITNGGFSLISEAVYMKKPVCSFPIKQQFEQFVNGAYIEKSGYGRHFSEFSADAVKAFLYDLEKFRSSCRGYRQDGNNETCRILDETIVNLSS